MTLSKYISDLLYRYDCVIVPHFGGFISNEISASVNHFTHTFYPPSKALTFNSQLKKNDGLLANYVAVAENISYSKALEKIDAQVQSWQENLRHEELELADIGSIHLNKEGKPVFEPSHSVNYLIASFGLSSYVSPAVKRLTYKEKAEKLQPVIPLNTSAQRRKTPALLKYAAAAILIFAAGTFGWKEYQNIEYGKLVAQAAQQQEHVEKSIQEATFVISNPLPAITLNVAKKTSNFHIIAGAFREPANAEKKLQQLLDQGYKSRILGLNKWNLTQVAYESQDTRALALERLKHIKETASQDAWLLVKEY